MWAVCPLEVVRTTHEKLTIAEGSISRFASAGALLVCPLLTAIRRSTVMGNVRRLLVLGLALVLALTLAAPAFAQSGEAQVRVAHLAPDAPNVDVYVNGEPVLTDVAYTTISGYLPLPADRKSTRLNSSHANISYAVFCLTKTHSEEYG